MTPPNVAMPAASGAGFRSLRTEEMAFLPSEALVLSSDGIEETLSVAAYPEAPWRNPEALAPRPLGDWAKGGDDAAVWVFGTYAIT